MTSLKLAGLLCSRLCHDLAGPIGALQNGMELMAEDDDPDLQAQALDLIALASGQAGRKLRFYRLVFGAGTAGGEDIAGEECRAALAGLLEGGRVQLHWSLAEGPWPRPRARLMLALALLALQGLPRGGRLTLSGATAGGLTVMAEGSGAALQEAVAAFTAGERSVEEAETPHEAVACLACALCEETAAALTIDRGSDRFTFQL